METNTAVVLSGLLNPQPFAQALHVLPECLACWAHGPAYHAQVGLCLAVLLVAIVSTRAFGHLEILTKYSTEKIDDGRCRADAGLSTLIRGALTIHQVDTPLPLRDVRIIGGGTAMSDIAG